jgi:hypothetical protein
VRGSSPSEINEERSTMNVPDGLCLIGRLVEVAQAKKNNGEVVGSGSLHEVVVETTFGERTLRRKAAFFAYDNETGEDTRMAESLGAIEVGSRVAVLCRQTAKLLEGGRIWTSLEAVKAVQLDEAPQLQVLRGPGASEDGRRDVVAELASGEFPGGRAPRRRPQAQQG